MEEKKASKVVHNYLKHRTSNSHTTGNAYTVGYDNEIENGSTTVRTTSTWHTSMAQVEPTVQTETDFDAVILVEKRKQALKEARITSGRHIHCIEFNSNVVCTCTQQALKNRGREQSGSVEHEDVRDTRAFSIPPFCAEWHVTKFHLPMHSTIGEKYCYSRNRIMRSDSD